MGSLTMEGGGSLLNNAGGFSGRHLATSKNVTKNQANSTRKWLASGFNGFGQLGMSKRMLPQFEVIQMPFTETEAPVICCASTWKYLAAATGCSLYLTGFIFNASRSTKLIKTTENIKTLASCDRYCLVLQEDGQLYKLMINDATVMEEVKFQVVERTMLPQKRSIFGERKSSSLCQLRIEFVACGNNIMVAIGNLNEVFCGTTQIHQFERHIRTKQLVCGFEHALLLTTNGDIYSWGNGLRGQLGQEVLTVEERPTVIQALAGLKIRSIASAGWHSAAISAFGDLYTWGYNSNGQLGLRLYKSGSIKEATVYPLPQIIETPNCCCTTNDEESPCHPLKVVCGARHTILLMSCGTVSTWGYNAYGQLGMVTASISCDTPQNVLKIENHLNSVELVGGAWCTLIRAMQ